MVAYSIVILPVIKKLKAEHPDITQPWYNDDADALGMFGNIDLYFNFLKYSVPGCGYTPPKVF